LEQSIIFRYICAFAFCGTFGIIAVHYLAKRPGIPMPQLKCVGINLGTLKLLVFAVAILSGAVLMATGFYSVIVAGHALTGYLLMLHAAAGPVFSGSLAMSALFLAGRNAFDTGEQEPCIGAKVCFWAMLVLSLPVILSSTVSMFALFGTDGQMFLYHLHRYSSVILGIVAIWYLYLATCKRSKVKN
jgi:hypothetical protein